MDRFEEQQRIFVQALNQIDDESDEDKELTNNLMQLYSSGQIPRDPEPREVFTRRYTYQGRDEWHEKLMHDYFFPHCVLYDENFQGRFRMPRHLVLKIIGELCQVEPQFNYQYDALYIRGRSPEQKTGYPTYWAGQYKGHYAKPTMILEAAASYDCWDTLFLVNFSINGNHYTHGYYLADGIYPKWSTLVQCYRQPPADEMGRSYSYFNSKQMNLRKDVERAFGILKRKFAIICGSYRVLSAREMHKTMLTCIIMHNMVIQETLRNNNWTNHQDEDLRPEIIPARGLPAKNYAQMTSHIENITLYNRLKTELCITG
ncbi:uncharacterized protein LOC113359665 [Papaver somniferum]|uniref:uncharacterized protein LOC113359665 n=1 Tax=Papaver somniferum TaxID=3469 RepID=UPI000E700B64|nr:uncharacterized protein LOC113359665 [Papaver somniferum]